MAPRPDADVHGDTVADTIGTCPAASGCDHTDNDTNRKDRQMKLIHGTEQHGTGTKSGSRFTGSVNSYLVMPATDDVVINTVNFNPGARTYWHEHERGQILQVLAGEGVVCTDADGIRRLRAGDTVWCPPGERHWHGAAPDSYMVHTAISLGTTTWADEVAQEEYEAPRSEGER